MASVPVVDECQVAVQAEDRLRIGRRAADMEWIAETGKVFGGGDRDGGQVGEGIP